MHASLPRPVCSLKTMYPSNFLNDYDSRLSEESRQNFASDSLVDHLRDRGLETESFRFADVSVYIDSDGNRYRIERLEPPGRITHNQPLSIPISTPASEASLDTRRVTDRTRFAAALSDPFPSTPHELPGRTRHDVAPPPHRNDNCRPFVDGSATSHASSRRPRLALSSTNVDLRHHQDSGMHSNHGIAQIARVPGSPRHPLWQNLERDAPSLDLSPKYPEARSPFARDHRTALSPASSTSPVSVTGASQSHISIPHTMCNGIDLRTPIVVLNSETSTISGDSLTIETETPGERLLLDT